MDSQFELLSMAENITPKKHANRDKSDFATKKHKFRVLAIIEIPHYRGLPITDPANQATLLKNMQTNITYCGQFVSVHSPFSSDLRAWYN